MTELRHFIVRRGSSIWLVRLQGRTLALLWYIEIDRVDKGLLTVWASSGWRSCEEVEDGLSYRWQNLKAYVYGRNLTNSRVPDFATRSLDFNTSINSYLFTLRLSRTIGLTVSARFKQ